MPPLSSLPLNRVIPPYLVQSAADVASSLITSAFSAGLPLVSFAIRTALLAERATLSVSRTG